MNIEVLRTFAQNLNIADNGCELINVNYSIWLCSPQLYKLITALANRKYKKTPNLTFFGVKLGVCFLICLL